MELEHFESLYPNTTRFDEIEKIISYVREGNSCQVISLAGVGRSNLLGLLAFNRNIRLKHLGEAQKNFHFVLLNFSEIRKKPNVEATKFIFLGLLDSLRERGLKKDYEHINKIFKESVEYNDELVIFTGLKKTMDYLAIEKGLTVILLFDRFEEYIPMLTSDFFVNLRVLRSRAKFHFSVIFSLNRALEDLIEPSLFADFFEYVAEKTIYLKVIDKIGLDFRISHLEKATGKKLDAKTLKRITDITGSHGRLTTLCLETALSLESELPNDNNQLINYFLDKRPIRSALFAIWNSFLPSEQQFFISYDKEPLFLETIGIANSGKITIPLFEEFVKHEIIPSEKYKNIQNEKIEIDVNTNEIKRGETLISDSLTALEFKLLRFMLENKEKIVGKEEIINAVWGEKTTTLGVTDQALDQLFFRLRKKIEQDPTLPKYIHTVKGRGFKFSD